MFGTCFILCLVPVSFYVWYLFHFMFDPNSDAYELNNWPIHHTKLSVAPVEEFNIVLLFLSGNTSAE